VKTAVCIRVWCVCGAVSSSSDQVIAQFVSQHGKTWPYWFHKMGQYLSSAWPLAAVFCTVIVTFFTRCTKLWLQRQFTLWPCSCGKAPHFSLQSHEIVFLLLCLRESLQCVLGWKCQTVAVLLLLSPCVHPWVPSVLWHCWLGGRKGVRPVKNWAQPWALENWLNRSRCRLGCVWYGKCGFI